MELREVTNVTPPLRVARAASLDKGPYTPGGRHFTSVGAEEATLRGAAKMLLSLLQSHKAAVTEAEKSGNYKAYKAACAALDDSLVLSRHAVRAVAPKDAPTQYPANDRLRLALWAALDHLETHVREGMALKADSPEQVNRGLSTPLALTRTRSDELSTPLRRDAPKLAVPPLLPPPPQAPVVEEEEAEAQEGFGGFVLKTPTQTAMPWARTQSVSSSDDVSPVSAFPLLSPVAEGPDNAVVQPVEKMGTVLKPRQPASEQEHRHTPPPRASTPLLLRILRGGLIIGATVAIGLAVAPMVAARIQANPAMPPPVTTGETVVTVDTPAEDEPPQEQAAAVVMHHVVDLPLAVPQPTDSAAAAVATSTHNP